MKTILFLTFMFIQFSFVVSSSQYYTLYPIVEKQKWGYINNLGEVVIEPQFYAADKFVEGLAAVRSGGYYGFIDTTGRFVISAKFDFAYAFQHGLAQVFVDGKPFIIDKEGEKLFDHNFKAFGGFDDRTCSVVRTKADEYGIIDQEGLLVLDTIYERISNFQEGRAIVTGARDGRRKNEEEIYSEIGLLDENGNFVIPFGVYDMIDPFENGFAKVWKEDKDQKRKEGIIDKDGKLQFWLSDKEGNLTGNVSESLIAIDIHTVDFDTIRTYTSSSRYSYKGYMNLQGELVFFNENWKEATDFNDGRAFVKDFEGQWYMIDKKGNVINQDIYYAIYADTYQPEDAKDIFQDGIALVKTEGGIGGIDTLGNFIIPPKKLLYKSPSFRDGEYLFLRGGNCGEYAYFCYTWWNIKTGQILENSFPDLNLLDEVNSIFRAKKEQQLYYLNEYGKVIWKQKAEEVKNIPINVDFMCRGYFYASSPYKEELAGSGGWGGSSNSFYAVKKTKSFKRNRLNLYVNVKENVPF